MKIDLTKFGLEYPLKAYEYGTMWQVRDLRSRDVLTILVTKLDSISRRKNSELIKFIVDELNADFNSKKEVIEDKKITEIVKKEIEKIETEIEKVEDVLSKNDDVKSKKRGRPKKNG